jgi:hypothetical protein
MSHLAESIDRGTFFRRSGGLLVAALIDRRRIGRFAASVGRPHPDPRPGITAERVLSTDALGLLPKDDVVAAYDAARKYPQIFDGLACACGCTPTGEEHRSLATGEHRSLLVCYETMQPTGCVGCQQQARLAGRLAKEGKSLGRIREALDKEYG